jgi:glycosyltransferase involved in cell wall biosynthesis
MSIVRPPTRWIGLEQAAFSTPRTTGTVVTRHPARARNLHCHENRGNRMDRPAFSLVTTCKGRLAYLKDSLPSWLRLEHPDYEIVVVDYDCPDQTSEWILRNKRRLLKGSAARDIRVVTVANRPRFNLNEARNAGIAAAAFEWIVAIDSDVHIARTTLLRWLDRQIGLGRDFVSNLQVLTTAYSEPRQFYRLTFGINEFPLVALPFGVPVHAVSGTAAFRKSSWEACGRYDPAINEAGYGWDDYEFYLRYLNSAGAQSGSTPATHDPVLRRTAIFPDGAFQSIENDVEERHRFYPEGYSATLEGNKRFIRMFFERAQAAAPAIDKDLGEVFGERSTADRPLASWLRWWYPIWYGNALFHHGRRIEAEHYLRTAFRHRGRLTCPVFADVLRRLHDTYARQGDSGRLTSLLREGSAGMRRFADKAESEQVANLAYRLANLAVDASDLRAAVRWYRRCLQLDAAHHDVRRRLSAVLVRQADGMRDTKQKNRLGAEAIELLKGLPNPTAITRYNLASLAEKLGQLHEARKGFASLRGHAEHGGGAYFHLGEIAAAQGRWSEASRCYRRCLRLVPDHRAAAQRLAALSLAPRGAIRNRPRSASRPAIPRGRAQQAQIEHLKTTASAPPAHSVAP